MTDQEQTKERPPEFIQPINYGELSEEAKQELIARLRERRMRARISYEEVMAEKAHKVNEKIQSKIDKKAILFQKQLIKVEEAINKLEGYGNEIAGLKLQLLPVEQGAKKDGD